MTSTFNLWVCPWTVLPPTPQKKWVALILSLGFSLLIVIWKCQTVPVSNWTRIKRKIGLCQTYKIKGLKLIFWGRSTVGTSSVASHWKQRGDDTWRKIARAKALWWKWLWHVWQIGGQSDWCSVSVKDSDKTMGGQGQRVCFIQREIKSLGIRFIFSNHYLAVVWLTGCGCISILGTSEKCARGEDIPSATKL